MNLHSLTVDEALIKLDKYLHDAFMVGLCQAGVIHGKGTVTLHEATHKALAKRPLVKSYRLGDYGEGGVGVTVVELV